jgi:hypothetical protein
LGVSSVERQVCWSILPSLASKKSRFDDQLALSRDLVGLIWQHKLWWALPVLLALLVLSLLLVLQATPLGPLLYPLF